MFNILVDGRVWSRNAAGITTFLKGVLMEWARQRTDDKFLVLLPKGMDNTVELPPIPDNIQLLDYSRRFPRRLPNIIILQCLVPWLCRVRHIDIYYTPLSHLPFGIPSRVKTVVTVHDVVNIEMSHTMSWTNKLANKYCFGRAVRKADILWANSNYTRSKIDSYFPDRSCRQVFVGDAADRSLFYPRTLSEAQRSAVRDRYGIRQRFLLFVGTLEPRKNLKFLLSIIPKLYVEHGIQLVVVGGRGWKNSDVKTIVDHPDFPKDSTIFCGYITNAELADLYCTADCFVSAALMEGFGMPQLEALMCGCPVVTADNTAMTEIATGKDGAFLVEGYQPEKWQSVILQVLAEHPAVNQRQLADYDWQTILHRFITMNYEL